MALQGYTLLHKCEEEEKRRRRGKIKMAVSVNVRVRKETAVWTKNFQL